MPVVPCVRPSHGSEQYAGERNALSTAKFLRRRLHEQADFPMASMIAERDGLAVGRAKSALRAENQKLFAPDFCRVPTHAGILRQPEKIAAGTLQSMSSVSGRLPAGPEDFVRT